MNRSPSPRIVEQRIRNRLIECLESFACASDSRCDLNELINQWADWVQDDSIHSAFPQPTYTVDEAASLRVVHIRMALFCEVTPHCMIDTAEEMKRPEWLSLRIAAEVALQGLALRGRLPEDVEAIS
ncbi:hypothetical protein [Pseudomonas leptonychotis]|uniref:hypothetical protein n=1 Tax=Pseudomonas leptonychotis TaxID=2448482 RepID=UPI003868F99E